MNVGYSGQQCSIIIVNWNGEKFIEDCFNSLRAQSYKNFEVVLVDNSSTDGSLPLAKLMNKHYDFVNQMCYTDIKTMLADDILVKVDRASMLNSLEVRCPFLDYHIVEYTFKYIPAHLEIKNGIKKYISKQIVKKYLPNELDIERKQGFDIPADLFEKTFVLQRLLDFPPNDFIVKPSLVKLVKAQKSGRVSLWHKLFALYFFLRWLKT